MVTHVIYGFFGLLAASVIALAIYLDKPTPMASSAEDTVVEDVEEGEEQSASVVIAGTSAERYTVVKVIDGDTVAVSKGGTQETVRMIGLNAPETGQCYTDQATQKLKSLLANQTVSLELDDSQGERDKYDRLLAYVFNEEGVNTAEALIEGGFAKEYTYSRPYKYQSAFKAAQSRAQSGGKGLWASAACTVSAPTATPPAAPAPAAVSAPTTQTAPKQTETVKKQEPKEEPEEEEEEEEEDTEVEEEIEEDDDPPSASGYTCSSNTYNCDSFKTHAEAQAAFDACGGSSNDIHRLDGNGDGLACESLP